MCFAAPQVFDSVVEYSVKTIVSVLSSSISCKVLPFEKEEILRIGSSISQRDCLEFIEVVNDVVSKLDQHGLSSGLLSYTAARVAVSASCCRYLVPSMHVLDVKSIDRRSTAISNLLCCWPSNFSLDGHEIPLRLLSWYLDPLTLKHDISSILQENMRRPFLTLSKEFYERMEWRSILLCLVLSPIMFIHTRALLHDWFMLTDLGSLLELLIELVSMILDVISRPICWGIPLELGTKLPFSNAYFPNKDHLLRTLSGPVSSSSFQQLVHATSKSVSLVRKQFGPISESSALKVASVDPKSVWALAICFPDWFYFASVLLFSNNCFQNNFQLECTIEVPNFGQTSDMEQPVASAARFIAWILSPNNKTNQDLLFESLNQVSECWSLKQIDSGTRERGVVDYWKKLKKPECFDSKEGFSHGNKYGCQAIGLWLKEFQRMMKYGVESTDNSSNREAESYNFVLQNSMLFRRIPLGILIGCPSYVKEDGFELLLHYAATGRMLHFVSNNARMHHVDEFNEKEAVAGACLVFTLTDIVERMSASLLENEKSALDIICQVKLGASRYLIKCIERLIELNIIEDGNVMQVDLHGRLERWQHQGQEMLKLDRDLDDAIKCLSRKLSLL
ncbi:hypothetical protein GH714_038816 [Hevea brasiliensis]|uniref:Uncharacterized protein n=1 Tax=Hevea brasiliensis TaxID=3981 RepID=A0A6A6KAI5_HEVBR|nr:hypothetical protein GH714_038816 [Hevea brasiliensis]